ncbi:MAG: TIM barrel protein [Candidatus Peribacteraceae bacterium]|nr:TIM barrel protein [Candidatus Peribacteraceae bacterium]MDD5739653.1 TIM barrel protein [Candidatus Peribacteraceae bacterium]
MNSHLLFAVAGSPHSTLSPGGTVGGLLQAKKLGITAMEIEWVQNVPRNPERMAEIRETAETLKITLTVHAPYFVNLNSPDRAKLAASKRRVLDALSMAELCGARSVCVHAAFNLGQPPEKVFENVRRATEDIMRHKQALFPHVNLAYETMGKPTQFGTLEEALAISKEFGNYPCVDPAHMHARENGKINSAEEWDDMFDLYQKYLGKSALKHVHMHFSGIAYTAKGERMHLPLQKSDARWKEFLSVLKKRKIEGVLVCESPLLEQDTLLMQNTYERLR